MPYAPGVLGIGRKYYLLALGAQAAQGAQGEQASAGRTHPSQKY